MVYGSWLNALLVSGDDRDRKAVVSFATHSLDCRGADARLRGKQFVEAAHPLDARIAAALINHRSVTHDIIGDNQAAAMGKLERPCEVIWIVWLVGINEDQVKWTVTLGGNLWQRRECLSEAQVNDIGQTSTGDVDAGDFGVLWVSLQRDQTAVAG